MANAVQCQPFMNSKAKNLGGTLLEHLASPVQSNFSLAFSVSRTIGLQLVLTYDCEEENAGYSNLNRKLD